MKREESRVGSLGEGVDVAAGDAMRAGWRALRWARAPLSDVGDGNCRRLAIKASSRPRFSSILVGFSSSWASSVKGERQEKGIENIRGRGDGRINMWPGLLSLPVA